MKSIRKFLFQDYDGGIEGLPLQLLIIVMVAGVGSAIMLGWMGGLEAPATLGSLHSSVNEIVLEDEDGDGMYSASDFDICITVLDSKGDPMAGASVTLEGSGITASEGKRPHALTDSQGKAYFEALSASRAGDSLGFITVTAAKGGMSSTRSISLPVICE